MSEQSMQPDVIPEVSVDLPLMAGRFVSFDLDEAKHCGEVAFGRQNQSRNLISIYPATSRNRKTMVSRLK